MSVDFIKAAEAALQAHDETAQLEPGSEDDVKLWHLLLSLLEFCDAKKIDFDLTLEEVRQYAIEFADDRRSDKASHPLVAGGPQFSIGMLRPTA